MLTDPVQSISCAAPVAEIVALYAPLAIKLDAAHPAAEWQTAKPVSFCSDWQGKNPDPERSEEHTSELQSRGHLVCRLLLEKKKYRVRVRSTLVSHGRLDLDS